MSSQSNRHGQSYEEMNCDSLANLSLLDPPRWGWSALGGITDMLPPHEKSRRLQSQRDFLSMKLLEKKKRMEEEKLKGAVSSTSKMDCDATPSDGAKKMLPNSNDSSENILKDKPEAAMKTTIMDGCSRLKENEAKLINEEEEVSKNDENVPISSVGPFRPDDVIMHHSNDADVDNSDSNVDQSSLTIRIDMMSSKNESMGTLEKVHLQKDNVQVQDKAVGEGLVDDANVSKMSESKPLEDSNQHLAMDTVSVRKIPEKSIPQDTTVNVDSSVVDIVVDSSQMQPNIEKVTELVDSNEANHSEMNDEQDTQKGIIIVKSSESQSFKEGEHGAGAMTVTTSESQNLEKTVQHDAMNAVQPPSSIQQEKADNVGVTNSVENRVESIPGDAQLMILSNELLTGDSEKVASVDNDQFKNPKSLDSNASTTNSAKTKTKSKEYNFGPNYNVIHKPKGRSKRDKFDIEVKGVKVDGSIHPDAYHRGIAGEEPRCKATGTLLCDTEPTDTNHEWDEPNLKFSVTVEFPLCDPEWSDDEIVEDNGSIMEDFEQDISMNKRDTRRRGGKEYMSEMEQRIKTKAKIKDMPHFSEEVEWDLSNPKTPTPILYATDIAAEFGLSLCSMLDLARSIQSQIDTFLRENLNYRPPISVKDHLLAPRGKHSLQPPKYSYPKILYGGHCATDITPGSKSFEAVESKKERCSSYDSKKDRRSSYDRKKQPIKRKSINLKHSIRYHVPTPKSDIIRIDDLPDHVVENVDFDETQVREFLDRAKMEYQRITQSLADGNIGTVKIVKNMNCHVCHKRRSKGVQFTCGTDSHCFCDVHCIKRFGLSVEDIVSKEFDICPVCCLQCTCRSCKNRLSSLVPMFFNECKRQGLCSSDVKFDFAFHCNRYLWRLLEKSDEKNPSSSVKNEAKVEIGQKSLQSKHLKYKTRKVVPKIPKEDFPAEMTHGINRDPSRKGDYNTIFTPEGATMCEDLTTNSKEAQEENTNMAIEDGNVDYCSECQRTGDIICCDVCPRGFHARCLALDTSSLAGRWECPRCLEDSTQQAQDLVEGTYHLDKLKNVFEQCSNTSGFEQKVMTLSKIFDAIKVLTEYEFGNIFSEPVDVKVVRDYKKYVKRPMDLGTITSKLLKGSYCKASSRTKDLVGADEICEMDVVILNVLKDVEQIWHNCFLYNREGSSFHRMGQVLQRKFSVIRLASFENELNPFVTQNFSKFVDECKVKRQELSNSLKPWIPKSKYHITIPSKGPSSKTIIGIFDKDTKMVVKQYTSITSACSVAEFLSNLGYKPEIGTTSKQRVREYIMSMQENPSLLLFGYRWLLMDNIRSGNFKLEDKPSSAIIQMKCGVSNSVLEEFDSVNGAYERWLSVINSHVSILKIKDFEKSIDYFLRDVVDEHRALDCMKWVRINVPDGSNGTVADIKNPSPSKRHSEGDRTASSKLIQNCSYENPSPSGLNPEGNSAASSQLIKNCSNENVTSSKNYNDNEGQTKVIEPIPNEVGETGKHSSKCDEKEIITRHGNQSFTQVSRLEGNEHTTCTTTSLVEDVNSAKLGTFDVGQCDSISQLDVYLKTESDDRRPDGVIEDHSCKISSIDMSDTILNKDGESEQRLSPEMSMDVTSSQKNEDMKFPSGGNPSTDSKEDSSYLTLSTTLPPDVLDKSSNNEATQRLPMDEPILGAESVNPNVNMLTSMTAAVFDACSGCIQGLFGAGNNYAFQSVLSDVPYDVPDTSNSNESTQNFLGTHPNLLDNLNVKSYQKSWIGISPGVLDTSTNNEFTQKMPATKSIDTLNHFSPTNASIGSVSGDAVRLNNGDSSQLLSVKEPALCTKNDSSCQHTTAAVSSCLLDTIKNDNPSLTLRGKAPVPGTRNGNSSPFMPPAISDTFNNDRSAHIVPVTKPIVDIRNDCSTSNTSSGMISTVFDMSNDDDGTQLLQKKVPILPTRNDKSYLHTSSFVRSGALNASNSNEYSQRFPATEPASSILNAARNNESTHVLGHEQMSGSGNDCSYYNASSLMTSSNLLNISNINEPTQTLLETIPVSSTTRDNPYQNASSSMNTLSQVAMHSQLLAPPHRILTSHEIPPLQSNGATLQSDIPGILGQYNNAVGIRATYQKREGSTNPNDSFLDTTPSQTSALEAETATSLLDFARAVIPSPSLGKRPVDDPDKTTDVSQSKRQRR
eukprot:CAMPEP_0176482820 /NCGR_PEP_ID=MMETSP0200_2-20121128/3582_1 /TAXON_ID=947934 /ORGANISM="Chaetoceros sp., Strain GSL56" /LENGTH=2163 /DNA_ID=CAMNT_0017879167 /DNA_START=38 /DNA_END=6529 /DNA_ORIENTATION=-